MVAAVVVTAATIDVDNTQSFAAAAAAAAHSRFMYASSKYPVCTNIGKLLTSRHRGYDFAPSPE